MKYNMVKQFSIRSFDNFFNFFYRIVDFAMIFVDLFWAFLDIWIAFYMIFFNMFMYVYYLFLFTIEKIGIKQRDIMTKGQSQAQSHTPSLLTGSPLKQRNRSMGKRAHFPRPKVSMPSKPRGTTVKLSSVKPTNSAKKKFYFREFIRNFFTAIGRIISKPFRIIRNLGEKLKPIKEKSTDGDENEGLINQYLKEYEKNR